MADPVTTASGVSQLIDRLKQDGVAAGQAEADRIVAAAKAEAAGIVAAAEAEADRIRKNARADAAASEKAGKEALNLAARDMLLRLREDLAHHFVEYLGRRIRQHADDKALLEQMILAVAGKARPEAVEKAMVLLPDEASDLEELRRSQGTETAELTSVAVEVAGAMLAEGVTIGGGGPHAGLRLRLEEGEVEIDLSDRAITEQLSRHLVPRFRALMEGVTR